jgi:heme/copper-type cytochrome/quinol oxidase subunit 4
MNLNSFKRTRYIFVLFPLIFFATQFLLKTDYRYYFTSAYDPAYAFLFNGLNLAQGKLGSGLAGFPGTPVQIFVALMIRLGYLFRGATPLSEDVLSNPEYYLNIAGYGIVILISLMLFFSGTILYRRTHKIGMALAIQLVPFLSITGLHFGSIVMCEPFLIFAVQGIALQLALFCHADKTASGSGQILSLSFFTAIGLTTKLVFLPMVLLPFFAVSGWINRLKYFLITLLASAVLLIPAYPDWRLFLRWLRLLLYHTGIYGSGGSGIIDAGLFMNNLKQIFSTDVLFTTIFILIFVYLLAGLLPGIWKRIHQKNYSIIAGIYFVIVIQLVIIGKHYLPHYMVTVYGLVMIAVLLALASFKKPVFSNRRGPYYYLIFVLLSGMILTFRFLRSFTFSPGFQHPFTETLEYVNSHVGNGQRIIVAEYSSAFKEYGLYFGLAFSSEANQTFRPVLKKLYPNTYFYNISRENYFDWNADISLEEILSMNHTTYLFRKSKTDTIPAQLQDDILRLKKNGFVSAFTLEYKNPVAFDYLYSIESDTNALKLFFEEKETIICNCELSDEEGSVFLSTDGEYSFEKAYMRSSERVYDGKYAVKLKAEYPYALDIRLKVCQNDYIKTFAWKRSSDDKGLIVLTDDNPDGIYRAGSNICQTLEGWQRINLNFRIPKKFQGNEIHFYLWYNGKDSCYFDDFEIKIFKGL